MQFVDLKGGPLHRKGKSLMMIQTVPSCFTNAPGASCRAVDTWSGNCITILILNLGPLYALGAKEFFEQRHNPNV
jgi:hypothetical protein